MRGRTATAASEQRSRCRGRGCTSSGRQWVASKAPTVIGIWCARAYRQTRTRTSWRRRNPRRGAWSVGRSTLYAQRSTLFSEPRRVFRRAEELVSLVGIAEPDLDHPAVVVRGGVDQCRLLVESVIDLDDLAADGRIELRDRLHRLDSTEDVVLAEVAADLRQLDKHDVAQLALRIIRNPNGDDVLVIGRFYVLVLFGIQQIFRDVRHWRR